MRREALCAHGLGAANQVQGSRSFKLMQVHGVRGLELPVRRYDARDFERMLMKKVIQHYFNPLHLYCRMRDAGIKTQSAFMLSKIYERYIYRLIDISVVGGK